MSSTSTQPSTPTSSTSNSPYPSSPSTYNFSIRETTIRNCAIGIGIALGILLICSLIAIQVLRTKIKRLEKERDVYVGKLNGVLVHKGLKYEALSPRFVESGHGDGDGGLVVPRAELGG